jgi:hypothetical protein
MAVKFVKLQAEGSFASLVEPTATHHYVTPYTVMPVSYINTACSNDKLFVYTFRSRYRTGYELYGRGFGVRVPLRGKIFLLSTSCRPAVWPIQPPIQ